MAMNKKRIGIFTASLDDEYQSTLWSAISHAIVKRELQLDQFWDRSWFSGRIRLPQYRLPLANDQNIDGLIIISSSVATFLNSKDLREYFSAWANIPRVSIGMKLPGMSNVTVDSEPSVSELVQHLYRPQPPKVRDDRRLLRFTTKRSIENKRSLTPSQSWESASIRACESTVGSLWIPANGRWKRSSLQVSRLTRSSA